MALASGTRVGIYEVTAKIGEGGMGEVYQARDTTLDRDVALKVLPEAFTADPDRLARFQREAKVLASLNHSNIGAIYGLEAAGETQALVLELIEGPTLADRIAEGPIPVDEALTIANQIAEALEAAHEQGIIHRDLKPANVKVKTDGTVKVLDFGLAKAVSSEASGASASTSATMSLTASATQMGMVIGTAAYMAPEQARGKVVDKRADIWAFGVVLFEMLTGRRVFEGEDLTDTIAAVVREEPDWGTLPTDVPARLGQVLRGCLRKSPTQRVRDVGDVRLAMEGVFETTVNVAVAPAAAAPRQLWQRPVPALAAACALLALGGVAVWVGVRPAPRPVARALLTPPPSAPLDAVPFDVNLAVTSDGRRGVYRGLLDGQAHLFVRSLDDFEATPLTGLGNNPRNPFVSPEGNRVGFFDAARSLERVSILGGPPVTVTELTGGAPRGASWGADDTIIFATSAANTGLMRVSVGGGEVETLTTPDVDRNEQNHVWPEILPEGRAVLFTILTSGSLENAQIAVLSLETGEYQVLFPGGSNPRYVSSGHIVYGVGGTLRAVEFDLANSAVTSEPIPVVDNVLMGPTGSANFAVARDGSLFYLSGSGTGTSGYELTWVDRSGREESLAAEADSYLDPRVSPDGSRLATRLVDSGGGSDIYVYDIDRNNFSQLTFDDQGDCCPVWTPDGERVAFSSLRNGPPNLYVKNADGTGDVERLTEAAGSQIPSDWSADDETLVLYGDGELQILSSDGQTSVPLFETGFVEQRPRISPDGRWVAYESDEDGDTDVYVRPFPDVDSGKWKVSSQGGAHPIWAPDGSELYYMASGSMMAASITREPTFSAGNSEILFEGRYLLDGLFPSFDLSPDGSRFLMMKPAGAQADDSLAPLGLVVVFSWLDELQRLMAVN